MGDRLHLAPKHREVLEALLRVHLPGVEVWAYGSRVSGKSHDGSDLDLVLRGPGLKEIPIGQLGDFDEAVRESSIPFLVEARDWARLPERFHREIEPDYVVLVGKITRCDTNKEIQAIDGVFAEIDDFWKTVALSEVADLNWGDTKTTKKSYSKTGYIAYSASGPDGLLPYADYERTGVVLSAIGSDCGKTWLAKGKWSCIKNTIRFFSVSDEVDTEYLYWITRDPEYWPKRGSGQPFISQGDARACEVKFPPLPQQRAIAHILGTLDDKIELNWRMNETLEAMARALFKSWFVDFDPVRAKTAGRDTGLPQSLADLFPDCLVDSELGKIPEGWEAGCLSDAAISPRRGIDPTELDVSSPYIGLEHMPRGSIALAEWDGSEGVTSNKSIFKKGEYLFGKLRPYFHKVGIAPVDGICSTDIVIIAPKNVAYSTFILVAISSLEFVGYTDQTSTGTKMPRTSWKTMGRYLLCLPPEFVAYKFEKLTRPNIDRIVGNVHENRALATLRDTLLPKLITGEIRVTEAERQVEAAL